MDSKSRCFNAVIICAMLSLSLLTEAGYVCSGGRHQHECCSCSCPKYNLDYKVEIPTPPKSDCPTYECHKYCTQTAPVRSCPSSRNLTPLSGQVQIPVPNEVNLCYPCRAYKYDVMKPPTSTCQCQPRLNLCYGTEKPAAKEQLPCECKLYPYSVQAPLKSTCLPCPTAVNTCYTVESPAPSPVQTELCQNLKTKIDRVCQPKNCCCSCKQRGQEIIGGKKFYTRSGEWW